MAADDAYARELLPPGRYEALITERLAPEIEALGERALVRGLTADESPAFLVRHLQGVLSALLANPQLGRDRAVQRQVALINDLLTQFAASAEEPSEVNAERLTQPALLVSVAQPFATGLSQPVEWPAPLTSLSENGLLTNSPSDPRLAHELESEVASADGIDLLCAFVTWTGLRGPMQKVLREARARDVPLRVITTTYRGVTEPRALEELHNLGAQIKISYDTRSTRLHAKAWRFKRRSGFGTAYVGSSNITHSALHEGLEWNVRLSQVAVPDLLNQVDVMFESYWDDAQFEEYDKERFAQAIRVERRSGERGTDLLALSEWFDIRPYGYQEAILERLAVERERHGHHHNLLVAATGTGKTVIAAFDYRALRANYGKARLLFIAHRREILQQSRNVFAAVLKEPGFGEFLVGDQKPTLGGAHLFASIQSLSNVNLDALDPEFYDIVIVDEFHHAAARTYRYVLEHLKPRELLGMTATPERADQMDVTHWFDGRIAAELRLWDALEQQLLCPFQYFGLDDYVDLDKVTWRGRGYDLRELDHLYSADDARAKRIVEQVYRLVLDPSTMRALGFCVSVEHARFMSTRFNDHGIRAAFLHADSSDDERDEVLAGLRAGTINVVFSRDLFNEGLDVPEVDTVLLLRPTESVTVFLQQIGRGLRKAPNKAGLTILDFIGQQRREFRFGPRFEILTRAKRAALVRHIEEDFPQLPAGCSIWLEPKARGVVLDNIKASIKAGREALLRVLRDMGEKTSLREFVARGDETGLDLDQIYARGSSWSGLRRAAGFERSTSPDQNMLGRAISRMRHIDDQTRVDFYTHILAAEMPPYIHSMSLRQRRLLLMFHYDVWGRSREFESLEASLARLWQNPVEMAELIELLTVLGSRSENSEFDPGLNSDVPLRGHQRYKGIEALGAMGVGSPRTPAELREGVYPIPDVADLLFVTLRKDPADFKPTTRYRDYALSPTLFHWESQSRTSVESTTGQRYINHQERGTQILLFAREVKESAAGVAEPFTFLGPATYVSHHSSRPIAITWKLAFPMPPDFLQVSRAIA